jgi:hypothetical protein
MMVVNQKGLTRLNFLKDFPSNETAYRASGKVHTEEYEKVVMRTVDEVVEQLGNTIWILRQRN